MESHPFLTFEWSHKETRSWDLNSPFSKSVHIIQEITRVIQQCQPRRLSLFMSYPVCTFYFLPNSIFWTPKQSFYFSPFLFFTEHPAAMKKGNRSSSSHTQLRYFEYFLIYAFLYLISRVHVHMMLSHHNLQPHSSIISNPAIFSSSIGSSSLSTPPWSTSWGHFV